MLIIATVILLTGAAHARSVFVEIDDPEVDREVELELTRAGFDVVTHAALAEVTVSGSTHIQAPPHAKKPRKKKLHGAPAEPPAPAHIELVARRDHQIVLQDHEEGEVRGHTRVARPMALARACRKLIPRFVATLHEVLELAAVPAGTAYEPLSSGMFDWQLGLALKKRVVTWDQVDAAQSKLRCQLSRQPRPCEPGSRGDDRGAAE